jgi:dCMP deaminase
MYDDLFYLGFAYQLAKFSPDPSTQNGALLVNPHTGIIVAYSPNTFPRGVERTLERLQSPLKYEYMEHAERGAVYAAAATGVATRGLTMFCPWFACEECARAIIMAGISEVVGHDLPEQAQRTDWAEHVARAEGMLTEAGVRFRRVKGTLGIDILFNGKTVRA